MRARMSVGFATAVLKAHTTAGQQIADAATQIASQNYTAERQNQLNAANELPAVSGAQIDQSINALQSVALPRLIAQYGSDVGLEEFRRRTQLIMQALTTAAGLSSPTVANEMTQSSSPGVLSAVSVLWKLGQGSPKS